MPPETAAPPAPRAQEKFHKYSFWLPRFWHGMRVRTWWAMVARNGFAISPSRLPMAFGVSMVSLINSFFCRIQWLFFERKIQATEIRRPPVFIIGHWRSGTTHLHELMVLDPQFASPTTYECFVPSHSLVTAWFVTRWMKFLLPAQRPMDNMATGWDRPQEDEFALCNLGVGTPYRTMAFPNRGPADQEFLSMDGVDPARLAKWKERMQWFVKMVTFRSARQVVMKSPPHTGRVRELLATFPGAKFVHIVRDPYVVFPSTVRLWKSLYQIQGLQVPAFDGLEEYVYDCFERMYAAYERDKSLIPRGSLVEVTYEEVVRNPVAEMQRIYETLDLGPFEAVRPKLEAYLAGLKDYKTNRYELPPALHSEVTRRWGGYAERYGYSTERVEAK